MRRHVSWATSWLVGSDTTTTFCLLSMTTDGGRTWRQQVLPPAAGAPKDADDEPTDLPVFFGPGKRDGIIENEFVRNADNKADCYSATIIYTTHDAGRTWQPTTPLKITEWGVTSFADVRNGWIWTSDYATGARNDSRLVTGTLYQTTDGGKSWTAIKSDDNLHKCLTRGQTIVRLDFVDATNGWASAERNPSHPKQRTLLRTTDGGKTWVDVEPKVQSRQ